VAHGHVHPSIPVEVADCKRRGAKPDDEEVHPGLKGSIAIAKKHRHVVGGIVRYRDVREAVAVEVADCDGYRASIAGEQPRALKPSGSVSEQHCDVLSGEETSARHHQVVDLVAVEIALRYRIHARKTGGEVGGRLKRAVSIPQRYRDSNVPEYGHVQVS